MRFKPRPYLRNVTQEGGQVDSLSATWSGGRQLHHLQQRLKVMDVFVFCSDDLLDDDPTHTGFGFLLVKGKAGGDFVVGLNPIDESWWCGEAWGKQGMFPINFVWRINKDILESCGCICGFGWVGGLGWLAGCEGLAVGGTNGLLVGSTLVRGAMRGGGAGRVEVKGPVRVVAIPVVVAMLVVGVAGVVVFGVFGVVGVAGAVLEGVFGVFGVVGVTGAVVESVAGVGVVAGVVGVVGAVVEAVTGVVEGVAGVVGVEGVEGVLGTL
ncbi:hypothetical protein E2C01_024364 [Portunus trituberculatus]|uniref:Uncharacterized protein n=1 Tax=Portunus trituberculatus TaxID=210409 RepID=A0A5B7ECZ5_PORTR|nr:hypothetical protein [Portunus trituberculatus]